MQRRPRRATATSSTATKIPSPRELVGALLKPGTPFVSVDPGSSCAWCTWRPVAAVGGLPWWRWVSWSVIEDWRPAAAKAQVERAAQELGVEPSALVVLVEGQFLGENPQTMMHTVARRGHVEAAADVAGARYFVVGPGSWQTVIRQPRDRGSLKRDVVKRRTKLLALREKIEVGRVAGAPEDVGDAFAIGYWGRQTASSLWAPPSALGAVAAEGSRA